MADTDDTPPGPPARYQLVYSGTLDGRTSSTPIGIRCLTCGRTSYNRNDVEQRYCGNCHRFHDDPVLP